MITLTKISKTKPLGAIHIHCRVKPGVNKNREGVSAVTDDAVELNVAAPPRDGEANKAVIKVMSEALNVAKSDLSITAGHKSRDKTIEINPSVLGVKPGQSEDQWSSIVRDRLVKHIGD
ncbi:hypothetical protein PFICI_14732 [Pestalotiopsis fici W106-1]|uniref:Uncharacterized protein n=1 Tax=Pestalotiopsis fici (strain W106-1 / CGMCC3.15140) TaxID=1229662 RepID=W3WLW2_PESFW|nr:uncharacterized protein PFICI_14732 [Pestalotiopsis fici W106-1]ETS73786.1 hypothetical protein PFICI_14732 [Pestalotiopsis fici W106-1]